MEPVAEQLVRPAEASFLREGEALQVVGRDFDAGSDVVGDGGQPLNLLVAEVGAAGLLLGDPVFKTLANGFGEGFELTLLANGEFHQCHDVGEDPFARGADAGAVEGFVSPPERLGGPCGMRLVDGLGQVAHLFVTQAGAVGAAVENLQGLDFVLVRGEILFELFGQRGCFILGVPRKAGLGHFVLAHYIDHLFVRFLNGDDGLAQGGVGADGPDGVGNGAAGGGCDGFGRRVGQAGFPARDFFVMIGVESIDQAMHDGGELDAVGGITDGFGFGLAHAAIEAGKAGRERGDEVLVGAAEGHGFQKLV